jgi:hypothetical protein
MSNQGDVAAEYGRLQKQVADSCGEIEDLEPGELEFNRVYDELVRSTQRLVALDAELPERMAEPGRWLSERIVRWSWWGQAAVAVALAVLVLVADWSLWWLLLVIPHLVATLAGCWQKVTARQHLQRRHLAFGLHAIGVLTILVVTGALSAWFTILTIIGWVVLGGAALDLDADQQKAGRR